MACNVWGKGVCGYVGKGGAGGVGPRWGGGGVQLSNHRLYSRVMGVNRLHCRTAGWAAGGGRRGWREQAAAHPISGV